MSPVYERSPSETYREIDRWEHGVGWLAHPEEDGRRASHAVATDDGVWVFDPVDAPGVDDLLGEFGPVAGVAVLADYHVRDAAAVARRHDVPVTVPDHLDRPAGMLDRVERVSGSVAGFELVPLRPLFAWRECAAYRERDGTLYVPDYLSTHDAFTVGDERLGLASLSRLAPTSEPFLSRSPERVVVGHGEGVHADAAAALAETFTGARRRFPRALANLPRELRSMLGAVVD